MLDSHPGIAAVPEGFFILNLYRKYFHDPWDKRRILRFYHDLWKETILAQWHLDPSTLKRDLLSLEDRANFPELCREVLRHYARQRGKSPNIPLGDKNNHYPLLVADLMRIFPKAKFIVLTRDYRDNILSFKKVRFDSNHPGILAYRWTKYNQTMLFHAQRHPGQFLWIRYEDLLPAPRETLTTVCSFLEVPFDSAMLKYYIHYRPDRIMEWNKNLIHPLDPQKAYAWRKTMPEKEERLADRLCGDLGEKFGYPRSPLPATRAPAQLPIMLISTTLGYLSTILEKLLFRLPLSLRVFIINRYRNLTGYP
jgi:hypothetical protein